MSLIYYDTALENQGNHHVALKVDKKHPCYRMVREAIGGKSVFYWDKVQAYTMYEWYVTGWNSVDIKTEFGERVGEYDFKAIIKASHYMAGKKPSEETIEEMWAAVEMEKKILKANGDEDVEAKD